MTPKSKVKILGSLLCFLLCLSSVSAAGFKVVSNGKLVAGLCPEPFEAAELEAMKILEKYLYLSTGDVPEIVEKGPRIVFKLEKGKMDIEGFRFSFPSKDVMVISGGGKYGLKYGAYEFCERFLGIRFLFQGKNGIDIPKVRNLVIPRKEFKDAPKFMTRFLFSNPHPTRKRYHDWYPHLKSAFPYRVAIGHGLYKMFPPSKYAAKHPDFYPIIEGKRYIPRAPKLGVHWQPCMTNPKVIAEAVKIICDAFAENPELRVWTLGQTDGNGYCECENCKKFYPANDVKHRLGTYDRSLLYIQFCNKIAEGVVKKYPDAKLSIFAYNHTSFAPEGVRLHPALIPVLTYDRANYVDPERKRLDKERQKGWEKIAKELCWYDYAYANNFSLPRILTHHMADRLREGYKEGIRHFNGEYFPHEPIVCDGPFPYVTLKMLWNPFQDENKIIDDWCRAAVGEKAAPYLRNYYEDIEKFWVEKVRYTNWFKRCNHTYWVMTWHNYLEALDPDFLERCEKNLIRCRDLAPAGVKRERAEYFLYGFRDRKTSIDFVLRNGKARVMHSSKFPYTVFKDDFNKGIGSWQPVVRGVGSGKIADFTPDSGRNNSGALVHPNRNGGASIVEKYFTVTKSGNFRLTVDYRCEGTEKQVVPYISAEWCDKKGNILNSAYYTDVHGKYNENWARMGFNFASAGQLPARLRIRLNCYRSRTGKVIIDNVELKSTVKDILKPEKNK